MKYRLTITLILLSSFHATNCMDKPKEASWSTQMCLDGIATNSPTQVKIALSMGADINYIDKKGFPLLYTAWVKDVNYIDKKGFPLLYTALLKKDTTTIDILFQQNNINFTLLEETIRNNNLPKIISLSQNNSKPSWATKICIAGIKDNLFAQVKFGLLMGADANYTDEDGNSLFAHACHQKNEAIVQELLQQKSIDVVTHIAWRQTLLHHASAEGLSETVELILDRIPNIADNIDYQGGNALHFASFYGHKDCLRILLSHNNKHVNQQNYNGYTPLYYACQNYHNNIINLLIENGADVTLQTHIKATPFLCLYTNTDDPSTIDPQIINQLISPTDDHGNTQLHLCATIQKFNTIEQKFNTIKFDHYLSFLQAHALDIFARNNDGKTATNIACEKYKQLYKLYMKEKNINLKKTLDIQEQVMHAFLRITRPETAKICFYIAAPEKIFPAIMPREIRVQIARYYYALNIETIVARKYHNNKKYYDDFIENKEKIRNELLAKPEPTLLWNA